MNKVILIGNLTRDPELSTTPNGINVCKFALAVARKFTNQEGERETDFFNIIAWRALGENAHKYLFKGNKAAVCGSIQIRQYEDKEGIKRTVVEVVAEDIEFLTPKNNDENNAKSSQPKPKKAKNIDELEDEECDDLPF